MLSNELHDLERHMIKSKKNKIVSDFSRAVFAGKNARDEYIDPKNHLSTPLIEIVDENLNPFKDDNVRIFAKDLRLAPFGQVKSGPAYEMYKNAKSHGELYEATSGNTGAALALLSKNDVVVYVNDQTRKDKIRILQLFGAQVVVANDGIKRAKEEGAKKDNINLDQYANSSNPSFFKKVIGPQIWTQTKGMITLFCTGLGTTGTMIGISNYLKRQNKSIKAVGVIVKENDSVPGPRTIKKLEEVSFQWEKSVDATQIVSAYDSYEKSLAIIRKTAIVAGPSSGFALQGLLQELTDLKKKDKLNTIRNHSGEIIAVFPILDSPWLYINDYFKHLDSRLFKKVQKED